MIKLDLRVSILEVAALAFLHSLAIVSLFYVNLSLLIQLFLGALLIIIFTQQLTRALKWTKCSVIKITIANQHCVLETQSNVLQARLRKVIYLNHLLTLLEFQVLNPSATVQAPRQSRIRLSLLADSLPEHQRKRLHGFLNHGFTAAEKGLG